MPLFIKIRVGLGGFPIWDSASRGFEERKSIPFATLELEELVQRVGGVRLGLRVLQVSSICFFVLNWLQFVNCFSFVNSL